MASAVVRPAPRAETVPAAGPTPTGRVMTASASSDGHASISVTQALLAVGVIDELQLLIATVIAGNGRRLLDGLPAIRLEPIRSTTSPAGHLLVDCRVIG